MRIASASVSVNLAITARTNPLELAGFYAKQATRNNDRNSSMRIHGRVVEAAFGYKMVSDGPVTVNVAGQVNPHSVEVREQWRVDVLPYASEELILRRVRGECGHVVNDALLGLNAGVPLCCSHVSNVYTHVPNVNNYLCLL
jgi:hypothetical protein